MAEDSGRGGGTRGLVDALDQAKHRFDPAAREEKVRGLRAVADRPLRDPSLLIQFREAFCFLQAHPDDPQVLHLVEEGLRGFAARVGLATAGRAVARSRLRDTGIAGTTIHYPFGYAMARWLARRARQEARQIAAHRGCRSPRRALIHLSRGDRVLHLRREARGRVADLRAGALGILVTRSRAGAGGGAGAKAGTATGGRGAIEPPK